MLGNRLIMVWPPAVSSASVSSVRLAGNRAARSVGTARGLRPGRLAPPDRPISAVCHLRLAGRSEGLPPPHCLLGNLPNPSARSPKRRMALTALTRGGHTLLPHAM
jgi:hypothetical protein